MKKGIYVILAVLTVFAMVMMSCPGPASPGPDPGPGPGGGGTKITLDPTTLEVEVGQSKKITAETDPEDDVYLTWTSSDPTVARVNNGGNVTGVKEGEVTITVKDEENGGEATCTVTVIKAVTNTSEIEVDEAAGTLTHKTAKLVGVDHFGSNQGTNNDDGSYTFDGSAGSWSGGGAQYTFPVPKASDTWDLSNYQVVELFLKVTDGSVQAKPTKFGNNNDLMPYPSGSQYITLNASTTSYKFVIEEAGSGIGFQRNTGGPATVKIEKAVFSKGTMRTITFAPGEAGTNMTAIPSPIKIPDGRTVNFYSGSYYTMPLKASLIWDGHTFVKWYNTTDNKDFNLGDAITKDLTLTALWVEGEPEIVDMKLNLDPATWGTLPSVPALTGGSPSYAIPTQYATTTYADNKLTIKFDGRNRQRAIVPLSAKQVEELMATEKGGVTFRIVGTVVKGADATGGLVDGNDAAVTKTIIVDGLHFAGFRLHLGDASAASGWNGTTTGKEYPLTGNTDPGQDHLVEYRAFDANKKTATVSYFIIQAMFRDSDGNASTIKSGFPEVIITVESITIEPGDTTQ